MGSSAKKKADKKKDFAKPKLKVGKSRPKPTNTTSTSFRAKGIVLSQQSLHDLAPTTSTQLTHNLTLLNHHSANTRRDSLAHITTVFASSSEPPIPFSTIVPALAPVILDATPAVRTALLTLLNSTTLPKDIRQTPSIPKQAVVMYIPRYLLYIHSAMTHISADVRADSTLFLEWLIKTVGAEGVRGVKGWGKTLKCWVVLMGWETSRDGGKSTIEFSDAGKNKKATLQHLLVLGRFLELGLLEAEEDEMVGGDGEKEKERPHETSICHMLPRSSNAYAHLGLFAAQGAQGVGKGKVEDEEGSAEDVESRRRVFKAVFLGNVVKGLDGKVKEAGEIGRVAGGVLKRLGKAMVRD